MKEKVQISKEKLIEIYFNPSDITCSLVSAEANDEIERVKNGIIDEVLSRIESIYPQLVQIEI